MAYLTDSASHLLLATDAVEHAKELYSRGRQPFTVADVPKIELALQIADEVSKSLTVLTQQMCADLSAARRVVA